MEKLNYGIKWAYEAKDFKQFPRLVCPVPFCGCDDIHLHGTETSKEGRGSTITMHMTCELGHYFIHKLTFHKGKTYIDTCFEKGTDNAPHEMWRD